MSSAPIRRNRPHDKIFRGVFRRVEHARGALRVLVDEEASRQLDWPTLRVEPGTYVEEALRDLMSDLVFSVRFRGSKRRALIYFLWDHQRQPDRMMPLRFLSYGSRVLKDYTTTEEAISGYVPTLIPLLVYQGPGEWPGPHALSELSRLPGEEPPPVYVDLRMTVCSLHDSPLPSAELTTLARTTFGLLRLAALGELVVANAALVATWMEKVHDAHGYDDYRMLLEYIGSAGRERGMIEAIIERSRDDVQETAMSAFDRLRAEGWEQGWEDGHEAGREEGLEAGRARLLRQLAHRFDAVPPHQRATVLAATHAQLDEWSLRVLTAASLDEVFGAPR